jgi:hypothetical protein
MNKRRLTPKEKGLIGIAAFAMFLIPASAYRDATPVVSVPTPKLPSPNAFDFYAKAGQIHANLVRATPKSYSVDPLTDRESWQTSLQALPLPPSPVSRKPSKKSYPTSAKEAWFRKALQALRQGFNSPYLAPPVRSYSTLVAYFSTYSDLARLLVIESHAKAERGNWAGASRSALDTLRIGHDVPRGAPFQGALVGYAINSLGTEAFAPIIPHLDAKSARAAATEIEKLHANRVTFAQSLQEEKWMNQAALVESFQAPDWRSSYSQIAGNELGLCGFGPINWGLRIRLQYTQKQTIVDEYTRVMDARIAEARLPYPSRRSSDFTPSPLHVEQLTPNPRTSWSAARNETRIFLLMTSLALRAFQAEHGQFPAQLSQLAPSYLKQIPTDPFGGGEPLHYRKSGNSYILYSVGPDSKDDGGKPIDDSPPGTQSSPGALHSVHPESKGDMVAGINR